MDYKNDEYQREPRTRRSGGGGDRPPISTGRGNRTQASGSKDLPQSPYYAAMSEKEFLNKSKVNEVLSAFKEDVVRIKSSDKNKWNEAVESVRSKASMNFPNDVHQPHENISREDVGERSSASWKIHRPKSKGTRNTENTNNNSEAGPMTKQSFESFGVENRNSNWRENVDPAVVNSAPLLKILGITVKTSNYCSGILAGVLIARAWIESFASHEDHWTSGSVFTTILWVTTTVLVLLTAIGFYNRVDTVKDDPRVLCKIILHVIPILLLLLTHYLNQSFQFQRKECMDYFKAGEGVMTIKNSGTQACERYKNGEGQTSLIILRVIPAIMALGIYTYSQFGSDDSLYTSFDI